MAQVSTNPPKFIVFVNFPNLMSATYQKYIYNQFRDTYGFTGVPILIHLKGKQKSKEDRFEDNSIKGHKVDTKTTEKDLQQVGAGEDLEDDFDEKSVDLDSSFYE